MLLELNTYPKDHMNLALLKNVGNRKNDLFISKYYPKFSNLKKAIAKYYRAKRFNLDIDKYLLRNVS
jgi:hypothetical protein